MSAAEERFQRFTHNEKIQKLRSYLAYLQPGDEDLEFINMLIMVRELNEYSRCLWGDTEIIAITCELQSQISKTLNGSIHFFDRPYWDDSHNNSASVDRFDDDKAKNYTLRPVVTAVSIFNAASASVETKDNNLNSIMNSSFLSVDKNGCVLDSVVYRLAKIKEKSGSLFAITLLNEATGALAEGVFTKDAAKIIVGY